jgi:glycosyltransferase involved in cell wall biosynthesis
VTLKIDIYHNIRWSRYKARVFSALHRLANLGGETVRFFQIADTDGQRTGLSSVELSYHEYPHELLFPGSYDDVFRHRLLVKLFSKVMRSKADLVLLPGYDRVEYWGMLFAAILLRKRRAVFCDSTLRDHPQSQVKGVLKWVFFKCCDGYFGYGQRSASLLRHYGARPDRIYQRCQAAALEEDYSEQCAREARIRLAPDATAPRYLYVGRLSEEKSLAILLRAFAKTLVVLPAARLILVGAGLQDRKSVV